MRKHNAKDGIEIPHLASSIKYLSSLLVLVERDTSEAVPFGVLLPAVFGVRVQEYQLKDGLVFFEALGARDGKRVEGRALDRGRREVSHRLVPVRVDVLHDLVRVFQIAQCIQVAKSEGHLGTMVSSDIHYRIPVVLKVVRVLSVPIRPVDRVPEDHDEVSPIELRGLWVPIVLSHVFVVFESRLHEVDGVLVRRVVSAQQEVREDYDAEGAPDIRNIRYAPEA